MKQLLAIATVLSCLLGSPAFAQEKKLDGNFWLTLKNNDSAKGAYVAGIIDAITFVNPFLVMATHPDYDQATVFEITTKFTKGTGAGRQVLDGLDVFFADYRNRGILMSGAAVVVLREIAGTPKAEIEEFVEFLRSIK